MKKNKKKTQENFWFENYLLALAELSKT